MVSPREVACHLFLLALVIALVTSAPVSKSAGQNEIASKPTSEKITKETITAEDELNSLPAKAEDDEKSLIPENVLSSDEVEEGPEEVEETQDSVEKRADRPMPAAIATVDITRGELQIDNQPMNRQPQQLQQQQQPVVENTQFFDEIPDTDSLAPKAVAEYLFLTGDRASFNAATADLLKSGILTPIEVRQYRDDVEWEFENIIKQLLQAETESLAAYAQPSYPGYISRNVQQKSYSTIPSRFGASADSYEPTYNEVYDEIRRMRMEELLEKEAEGDQLLQALIEDYMDNTPSVPEVSMEEDSVDPERDAEFRVIMDLMAEAMKVPEGEEEPLDMEEQERLMMPMEEEEELSEQPHEPSMQQLVQSLNLNQQQLPMEDQQLFEYPEMEEKQEVPLKDQQLFEYPDVEEKQQQMPLEEQQLFEYPELEQQQQQQELPVETLEPSNQIPQSANQLPEAFSNPEEKEELENAVENELEALQSQQSLPAALENQVPESSEDDDKQQHTEVETKAVSDAN